MAANFHVSEQRDIWCEPFQLYVYMIGIDHTAEPSPAYVADSAVDNIEIKRAVALQMNQCGVKSHGQRHCVVLV